MFLIINIIVTHKMSIHSQHKVGISSTVSLRLRRLIYPKSVFFSLYSDIVHKTFQKQNFDIV